MAGSNITVTVVVSGAPQSVTVNAHQKAEQLMREALKEAGILDADLSRWHLRLQDGGEPIPPSDRIADVGIVDGATLFLDPEEGGGGNVSAPPGPAAQPFQQGEKPPPLIVDPEVSRAKLRAQLDDWNAQADVYRERGWILLGEHDLRVEIGFCCRLPVGRGNDLVAMPLAVRIGFENYDVWAPSVQLIDPIERRPLELRRVDALDFSPADGGEPEQSFIEVHPDTGRVFFCKRGVREYHSHFEHDGDDWLLYRGDGYGTLVQLCDLLWRRAVRTIVGLNFISQRIPVGDGALPQLAVGIRQDNVDALSEQVQAQMPAQMQLVPQQVGQGDQVPPEIQAILQQIAGQ
jgi:putative metal binding uncharacterized protein/uncharacterized protein DUF2604